MRILQMGPYPPPHGGVQTHLVAIRGHLLKNQIPCAVINLTRHRKPAADEVYYPESALEVLRLLARLRYDIIHLHIGGNLATRLLALGFLCSLMPRKKIVLTFHSGGYPLSEEGRAARPRSLRGFVLRRFDRVIGVNQELVEFFERVGVAPNRIRLIHPHALSTQAAADSLSPQLETFFETHQPVLTTVGLLEPEYDLPLQIEALGLVHKRFPNAGLVIVGSGSLEEELRNRIGSKPYEKDILLCGDVPHAVTLRAVAESDAFLRTTLYDGDSISVREALHAGVPVIATDNGMRPQGIELIPSCDLAALHAAIEACLSHENTRQSRGAADEQNLEAVLEVYRELMQELGSNRAFRKVELSAMPTTRGR
jgi:glycosyltransferase involved in cell wall biosynthesis